VIIFWKKSNSDKLNAGLLLLNQKSVETGAQLSDVVLERYTTQQCSAGNAIDEWL